MFILFSNVYLKVLFCILNPNCLCLTADRRAQFEILEYTEDDYQKELEHIEQVKPPPLVLYLKVLSRARICYFMNTSVRVTHLPDMHPY